MSPHGKTRPPWTHWLLWLATLAVVTAGLLVLRGRLDKAHVALIYLLVVLGGSAAAGRWLGTTLSVLAFLALNFLFLPPYYTLAIGNPLDWLALVAFLATGIVAAQLLSRAQERAEIARRRAEEVERLASLGAEMLGVGSAEEALGAVATVIRAALAVSVCEILVPDPHAEPNVADTPDDDSRFTVVGARAAVQEMTSAATQHSLRVPLVVRDRRVGVLRLADTKPIVLDPDARRFLDALAYYAALGVERVRLTAAAERAEAFRQADELKTALLATVSHDLRTPLTTIKALAHQLSARGEEDALTIEEEADRLNRLVADLLDLSRLSAGALPLRIELDAVDDLIATALDRLRGPLAMREVRVSRVGHDADEPILFARFDLAQSQRALVNLLENANKYSPPAEPIELWIARLGDRVRLTVADRGPGVAEQDRLLIFEPFYRPEGSRPDVGGAGLGLAIARRVAEAQGGSLTYAPRPGGGSEFRFELPAGTAAELAYVHDHFMPDRP